MISRSVPIFCSVHAYQAPTDGMPPLCIFGDGQAARLPILIGFLGQDVGSSAIDLLASLSDAILRSGQAMARSGPFIQTTEAFASAVKADAGILGLHCNVLGSTCDVFSKAFEAMPSAIEIACAAIDLDGAASAEQLGSNFGARCQTLLLNAAELIGARSFIPAGPRLLGWGRIDSASEGIEGWTDFMRGAAALCESLLLTDAVGTSQAPSPGRRSI